MSPGDDNADHGPAGQSVYWLSWMLGAAILVAVVLAALHVAEGRELFDVAGRAKPWWLVLAVCLQGATYLAQGEVFRRTATRMFLGRGTNGPNDAAAVS